MNDHSEILPENLENQEGENQSDTGNQENPVEINADSNSDVAGEVAQTESPVDETVAETEATIVNEENPQVEESNEAVTSPEEIPHTEALAEIITEPSSIQTDEQAADETPVEETPEPVAAVETTKKPGRKRKEIADETPVAETFEMHEHHAEEEDEEHVHEIKIEYEQLNRIELIEKLEELVKITEISKIKAQVAAIKLAYINLTRKEKQQHLDDHLAAGGTNTDYFPEADPLEERFKFAFENYKRSKIRDDKEQEKIKLENLEHKKKILEEIKVLINSEESLKKTYDEFRLLQDKWKQTGNVPRTENESLWNNYHFLVEKFFEKVKIGKELKDLDLKKNLEAKISLCEKAEELVFEKSITRSFKLLQQYHDEWKEIGPVSQDKKDEIWERFKNVSDKINQHRKEYYDKLYVEQQNNFLAKSALCEKIEEFNSVEISNINEWKEKTDQLLEMQKLWDTIGRAPAKQNDEVWERFRAAINLFYKNKKEYFGELKDQQTNNYNQKLDLCVQAEALVNSTNWKQATAELLKLQQEWKKIGAVPKRHSDKIWKRFRAACDDFFARKAEFFSNIHSVEQQNQKKKEELIQSVNGYEILEDKKANLENLKSFQRAWVEIGYVPLEAKEKLHNDFKTAINNLMDRLKISTAEVNSMKYKERIESLQNDPDAKANLYREKIAIETKLSKIKAEIMQWENNLGFFASSKKADLLKEEFERKIQSARQEAALLEAKLKVLRSQK